ncbi:GQ67_00710T0 [Komagataella phaffii]|nr:GQ67_00710T0 [Komagataella phaffii]AOA67756.1 GQ68_00679T0 [Komagataella phaffii GS115]
MKETPISIDLVGVQVGFWKEETANFRLMTLHNLSENWWVELGSSNRQDRLKEVFCQLMQEELQTDALHHLLDTDVTTYLWEHFSEHSTEYHVALLVLLSNHLYYSFNDLQLLELFGNDSRFDLIVEFITSYTAKRHDGKYSEYIQSQMIQFMNSVFQNTHFPVLRKVTKRLTSIGTWHVLPNVSSLIPGDFQDLYKEAPPESWIYDLIQLDQSPNVQSLLLTLITQLPTRRFIGPLLKHLRYVSYIETFFPQVYSDKGFQVLVYYLDYPIDDITGQPILQENFLNNKVSIFDRIHLALFEQDQSFYQGLKKNFLQIWSHLSVERVEQVAISLDISTPLVKLSLSEIDYRRFVYNEIRHLQQVTECPLAIDEKTIFYEYKILPRIGNQYMDSADFCFRHSLLYHAEMCVLIFEELKKSLDRISVESADPLRFSGSSRKLCPVEELVLQDVKVWDSDVPIRQTAFTADIIVDTHQEKNSWSQLKPGDSLVLLHIIEPNQLDHNIQPQLGIKQLCLGQIHRLQATKKGKSLTISLKLDFHIQSANLAFIPEKLNSSNARTLFERSQMKLEVPEWYSSIFHHVDVSSFPLQTKDNIQLTNVQWAELSNSGFNTKSADSKRRKGIKSLSAPFIISFEEDIEIVVKSSPLLTSKVKENLTKEQTRVVLSTLKSRLTIVDGVPGSGKSLVSAVIANHFYKNFGESSLILTSSTRFVEELLDCPGFRIFIHEKTYDFEKDLSVLLDGIQQIAKQVDMNHLYGNDVTSSILFFKEYIQPEWEKLKGSPSTERNISLHKIFGSDTLEGMTEGYRKILQMIEGITFLRDILFFPPHQRITLLKKKAAFCVLSLDQLVKEDNLHFNNLIIDDAEQVPEFVSALPLKNVNRMALLGDSTKYSKFDEENKLSRFGHNCSLFHKLTATSPPLKLSSNLRQPEEIFNLYSTDPKHIQKNDQVQVIKVAGMPIQIENGNNQNIEEAEYCVYLYMLLNLTYSNRKTVIYTPFSAQKVLLEEIIRHRCPQNGLNVRLFSSVEQCDYSIMSYVNTSTWNVRFKLHVNVLSRPKLQVFIFIHPKLLSRIEAPFPLLRKQSPQLNVQGTTIKSKSELITLLKTKMAHHP